MYFLGLIYVARILHSQNDNYHITILYSKICIKKLPSGKSLLRHETTE